MKIFGYPFFDAGGIPLVITRKCSRCDEFYEVPASAPAAVDCPACAFVTSLSASAQDFYLSGLEQEMQQ